MADHDGYCHTCKWCLSWTQQEQHPRAGATANLAGQFAQSDYELVNVAHYQCRRYPPQVFGEATVQPAGFWRQTFPACRPASGAASTRGAKGSERGNASAGEW